MGANAPKKEARSGGGAGGGGCRPVESTVFALLAGFSNYGLVVSAYVGAYALEWIGLAAIGTGPIDDFGCAAPPPHAPALYLCMVL